MFSVKNKITQIYSIFCLSLLYALNCHAGQGMSRALARVGKMWRTENAATQDAQAMGGARAKRDVGVQADSETRIDVIIKNQRTSCKGTLLPVAKNLQQEALCSLEIVVFASML